MFNGLKCSENKHILSQVLTTGLFPRQLRWAVVWMADATGGADQSHDKMLARNRFLLLVVVGGAALAVISLSLQFCEFLVLNSTASHFTSPSGASAR